MEQNPLAFGITAPITSNACIAPKGWPFGSGYGFLCAPTTTPPPAGTDYGYLVSADATQTHLFMDGTHLTQAGQLIVADYFYSLLVAPSEMSFLAETAIQTTFRSTVTASNSRSIFSPKSAPCPAGTCGSMASFCILRSTTILTGFPNDPGHPALRHHGRRLQVAERLARPAPHSPRATSIRLSRSAAATRRIPVRSVSTRHIATSIGGATSSAPAAWLDDTTNRTVPIGITVQPNNGSTSGHDLSLAGEIGYDFHAGPVTHGPVAGFILQQAKINGFTESGSFTSLSFGAQIRNSEVSVLGYQTSFDWEMLHPFLKAVWDHEFDPLDRLVTASLTTMAAPSYSLPAVVLGRDWATTTVGTQVTFAPAWSGIASFTAQLGQNHALVFGGLIGLNYSFGQDTPAPVLFRK